MRLSVAECDTCQRNHYESINPPGLLQPLSIPENAWRDISMDFVEGLPSCNGKSVLWVVIDRFTKYAHFVPLSHPYTAKMVADVFIQDIFRLHGMPRSIVTDRDPIFLSLFWESFFKSQGTTLCRSTAYHPESDGQTENLNRTVDQYLRCVLCEKPVQWTSILPWAEWWYNTTYHSAIKMSPFEALYGYAPPRVDTYLPNATAVEEVDRALRSRDELLGVLKKNLVEAQTRMKNYTDKHRTEREFSVGDMVFLKLQSHRQHSVHRRSNHKLSPRYYGPYEVLEKIGNVAYRLKLPVTAKIHPVFYVSLLKKKVGAQVPCHPHLPPVIDPNNPRWYPAKIIARGMFKQGNTAVTKWLIQWLGGAEEDATWEKANEFSMRFPEFAATKGGMSVSDDVSS